jgi:DNA primase
MQADQQLVDDDESVGIDALRAVTDAVSEILTAPSRRAAAATYLRQRGIDPGPLTDFPLGYAPPGWTRLVDHLSGAFPDAALLEAGVARRSRLGNLIDAFRDRVIFPVRTPDGHVAGFIGRDLSGDPRAPKYLNSSASNLFSKGELLYGLAEGLAAQHNVRRPVVLEGPLDVLAVASRSQREGRELLPIAASGTAFTTSQARTVSRIAAGESVVVALDGDAAGQKAAIDTGQRLRAAGADVRIAVLPNGLDPAEYLAQATASLDTFTASQAVPVLAVAVQHAIAAQGERMQWIEGRLGAARTIAKDLATYPVGHAAKQIGWIAHALELDAATFTFELLGAYRALAAGRPIGRHPMRELDPITI